MSVWIVTPAYNEDESLGVFVPEMVAELLAVDPDGRVVVVDDGSTDATAQVLAEVQAAHPQVVVLSNGRNRGKAVALQEGFRLALAEGAETVLMMDADGQDDPAEIPALLKALDDGLDLVNGARVLRRDRFIKRTTSRLYNRVTRLVGGAPGADNNSGFKAMRRAVVEDVEPMMYGELHRYLTVIAHWSGYRVGDVPVTHRPRRFGTSKYGLARFWRGFIDLITVRFLLGYQHRPLHMFGGVGFALAAVGALMWAYLTVLWLMGQPIGDRPLVVAATLLVLAGLQLLLFGLLAELIVFFANQHTALARRERLESAPLGAEVQAARVQMPQSPAPGRPAVVRLAEAAPPIEREQGMSG